MTQDTNHNDTQHNDTQNNKNSASKVTLKWYHSKISIVILNVVMLGVAYAE